MVERFSAGDVIGGYTVIGELGSGGMGTVYLVQHPRLPRTQALKVLASALGSDAAFRARFRREAELASRLDHANIVAVHDAGVDGEVMWIAMQYIEGTDAAAMLRSSNGPLPAAPIVEIIAQVASALDYAHSQGTLHRDVKPANILLTPGWREVSGPRRAFIGDFGVARLLTESTDLTGTGNMIGTLAYAAPELFENVTLTPAVDEYALGCTLYELLAGQPVFPRPDQLSAMTAHATAPVPRLTAVRPDLPAAVDEVIARALAKRPQDRFRTCAELASAASAAVLARPAAFTTLAPAAPQTIQPPTIPPQIVQPQVPMTSPPTVVGATSGIVASQTYSSQNYSPYNSASPVQPAEGAPLATAGRPRRVWPWLVGCAAVVVVALTVAVLAVVLSNGGESAPETPMAATTSGANTTSVAPPIMTRPPNVETLGGTWRGAVSGDQTGFDVIATIAPGSPVTATVEYPQLGCAGTWTEQSRTDSMVMLTERIDRGTCVTSQITLTPSAEEAILGYRSTYFSESRGRDYIITATLRRS